MRRALFFTLLLLPLRLAAAEEATVVAGPLGAAVDRALQRTTGGGFWGAALVAKDGEVLLARGYGFLDYGRRPITPDALFELASASKPFTAAAVLRLAMDGKLRLEDTLARHLRNVPADKRDITIHQVLSHTAGLSPDAPLPYASRVARDEAVRLGLALPLVAKPGAKFVYANFGYTLLAAIVERASGDPFEQYLREKLFRPAGMGDTGFIGDKTLPAARMTTRLSETLPEATAGDWFWGWGYRGMGGVVTTVRDLWRWDRALRGDAVLDAKTRSVCYRPVRDGYACGWLVETTPRGTTRLSHSGKVEGYLANYVRHLEDDAVIVLLSNGRSDIFAATKAIEKVLFPEPRVTVSLDVGPYEANDKQAVEFPGTAAWRVREQDGAVLLVLEHKRTRHAVATIRLPAGPARKLMADLTAQLADRRGGKKRLDAGTYLGAYRPRDGKLELREGVQLVVLPRYEGVRDGRAVDDPRILLVVLDQPRGQWPLMAHLDGASARALRKGLAAALK